jgi:hypothetical protein
LNSFINALGNTKLPQKKIILQYETIFLLDNTIALPFLAVPTTKHKQMIYYPEN